MGHFRTRDVLLVPSLVSLTRIPLATLFAVWVEVPVAALAVLLTAGASDVLDGWYARRFDQATATGAVIDGITDKAFMATVVIALLVSQKLGWLGALLLATRELGELPLVLWWTLRPARRRARARDPRANAVGKLCTTVQFFAVAAALFETSWVMPLLGLAGLLGIAAAAYYWRRETKAR